MSLLDDVGRLTMQVARPLLWHDLKKPWPKHLTGGSCFSGGPVLMHVERAGRHRFFAIGAIVDGPGKSAEGALGDFDRFLFRRVHCVNLDGTLKKDGVGWLPGPP
jgi:hypothetical protein